jgi:hypothetical protein
VQEAERFEPDGEEIAAAAKMAPAPTASGPFELTVQPERWSEAVFDEVKAVFEHHKGECEVHFVVEGKRFKAGEQFKVRPSSGLRAEIDHVLTQQPLAA